MRTLLKLTMEIQNPNIYTYYKIKSFIKIVDSPFVNFKMRLKEENINEFKKIHNYKGIYTYYTCSDKIIKLINQKMNKFYEDETTKK